MAAHSQALWEPPADVFEDEHEVVIVVAMPGVTADAVEIAGVLSHFANTEDVTEQNYAGQQLAAFDDGTRRVGEALGLAGRLERHIAASAAALLLPQARHDVTGAHGRGSDARSAHARRDAPGARDSAYCDRVSLAGMPDAMRWSRGSA